MRNVGLPPCLLSPRTDLFGPEDSLRLQRVMSGMSIPLNSPLNKCFLPSSRSDATLLRGAIAASQGGFYSASPFLPYMCVFDQMIILSGQIQCFGARENEYLWTSLLLGSNFGSHSSPSYLYVSCHFSLSLFHSESAFFRMHRAGYWAMSLSWQTTSSFNSLFGSNSSISSSQSTLQTRQFLCGKQQLNRSLLI